MRDHSCARQWASQILVQIPPHASRDATCVAERDVCSFNSATWIFTRRRFAARDVETGWDAGIRTPMRRSRVDNGARRGTTWRRRALIENGREPRPVTSSRSRPGHTLRTPATASGPFTRLGHGASRGYYVCRDRCHGFEFTLVPIASTVGWGRDGHRLPRHLLRNGTSRPRSGSCPMIRERPGRSHAIQLGVRQERVSRGSFLLRLMRQTDRRSEWNQDGRGLRGLDGRNLPTCLPRPLEPNDLMLGTIPVPAHISESRSEECLVTSCGAF
jgi:hypothetical protein